MIGARGGKQDPDDKGLRRSNVHIGLRDFREPEHFGNVVVGKQHYKLAVSTISSLSRMSVSITFLPHHFSLRLFVLADLSWT